MPAIAEMPAMAVTTAKAGAPLSVGAPEMKQVSFYSSYLFSTGTSEVYFGAYIFFR
jgi:hypothetical protein